MLEGDFGTKQPSPWLRRGSTGSHRKQFRGLLRADREVQSLRSMHTTAFVRRVSRASLFFERLYHNGYIYAPSKN